MTEPASSGTVHRRARIGSVAVGYMGVSWLILQVVDVIRGILPVPSWIAPGVLVVLGIGFIVVLATAWIQADPDTTRRELTGEVPSDWQVKPRDAIAALLRGQLPHLTWGRALVGGVFSLSLLFGAAGVYVLLTQRSVSQKAAVGGVRVAAMPFTTSGSDLDVYREGMVELLTTNLDGLGDIRAVASRTVLARWDKLTQSGNARPDLDAVLETAREAGATHAVVGSIVAAGAAVRLNAQLFDLGSGVEFPVPNAEGPAEDILALVDQLSVSVVRTLLGSDDALKSAGSRLASLTTSSVEALRLYLQAEALYRRAAFDQAIPLLDRAVAADPTFGLAVMRRAQAFGWLGSARVNPDTLAAARRAIAPLLSGMSQRDATLAEAGIVDFAERDANAVRMLREFVKRYPDDAEGWYQLSDWIFHLNDLRGGTREEVLGGLDRAAELGPRFAPYYIHAIEAALGRSDSARARVLLDRYRELASEDTRWKEWRLVFHLLFQPDSIGIADQAEIPALLTVTTNRGMTWLSDQPQRIADITARYLPADNLRRIGAWLRAGRWSAIREASATLPPAIRDSLSLKALRWAGAFGLERAQTALMSNAPPSSTGPDFWVADAPAALARLLAARDDGTGADPVLLAHIAERAGDTTQAESFFNEESWREFGPAMTYRLARLYERTNRPKEALEAYERFLNSWSGGDPDSPPVREAKEAVARLKR